MYGEWLAEAEVVLESLREAIARLERARAAGQRVGNASLVNDVALVLPALQSLAAEFYRLVEVMRGGSMFVARSYACHLEKRAYSVKRSVEDSVPSYIVRSIAYVLSLVREYSGKICRS